MLRRIGFLSIALLLVVSMIPCFAVGSKTGSIAGAATIYTSSFELASPGSHALKAGIRVKLKPEASYRTVSLTTTLQKKNSSGSYVNVSNFAQTVQKAGIKNESTTEAKYFPSSSTYTYGTTGNTMITAGTYRYKEFARSTVSDALYTTYYSSSLN